MVQSNGRSAPDHPAGGSPPEARSLDCNQLVELVTEYLDDALDARERSRFERHLAECGGCAEYLEQIRMTIRAAGDMEPDPVPPVVLDRLLQAYRDFRGC